MKKIFLILLCTGFMFTSCDEETLLEPYTPGALVEETAVQTSAQLRLLMNSTYANLYSREEAVFTSVFTDEAGIGYANGGQGLTTDYVFFLNPSSAGPENIWATNYFALSRANRVIKFADQITATSTSDADEIKRIKGEALAVRALCHLSILSYFSPDPKNDGALAGILANRIIVAGETPARATNGAFYTLIHSDLNDALAIFASIPPATYTGNAKTYYANEILAKALKARAYALKGDYPNAETWANDVIATSGIQLATAAQYPGMFYQDNEPANTEVIFRIKRTAAQNTQGSNMHNGWCSVRPNLAGSPFYEVSRALFNKLNVNAATDARYKAIVAPSSLIDPGYATSADYRNTDRLILHKYGGVATGTTTWASTAANGNNNDLKVVRLSEMYFIKAEARAAANDPAGAALAVKAVLDRRFPTAQTVTYGTTAAAWTGILAERRLEFAFEGYRFVDLKRLGTLAGQGIDRDPADYTSSSANYPGANPSNLPLTSFKWALPIPQSEINGNGGIQQNPGY
jgi:starch-binding outer membrane protein, SusD/RagB family